MIIPVKCFTCGNVLANKYRFYLERVKQKKIQKSSINDPSSCGDQDVNSVVYLTKENMAKTPEAEVLDELKLFNVCCRRHMLTHVDIE